MDERIAAKQGAAGRARTDRVTAPDRDRGIAAEEPGRRRRRTISHGTNEMRIARERERTDRAATLCRV